MKSKLSWSVCGSTAPCARTGLRRVVDDQDPGLAMRRLHPVADATSGARLHAVEAHSRDPGEQRGRAGVGSAGLGAERKGEREPRAPTDLGRHADRTAVQLHELPGDRQPQAGTAELTLGRSVALLEALEDGVELVGRDTGARVRDGHGEFVVPDVGGHLHPSLGGELDPVPDHVVEDLLEAVLVAVHQRRRRIDAVEHLDRLVRDERPGQREDDIGQRAAAAASAAAGRAARSSPPNRSNSEWNRPAVTLRARDQPTAPVACAGGHCGSVSADRSP